LQQVNVDEALKAAFHVWAEKGTLPSEVRSILYDPLAINLSCDSTDFWIVASALRSFYETEHQLPLEGSIPDMHASTDLYLRLQRVYRDKAESDILKVEAWVSSLMGSIGRTSNEREGCVSPSPSPAAPFSTLKDTIRLMCKHARNLRVVRWPSLATEASGGVSSFTSALSQSLSLGGEASDPRQQAASIYVLFKAADRFFASHGRYPGSYHEGHLLGDVIEAVREEDVPVLKSHASSVLVDLGVHPGSSAGGGGGGSMISDDLFMEMCRFGAGEMHVVASIVGGMASQESIKIITKQFTPANGTLIYNGIECTTTVFA
jgi:amyloid beta precursor protein binding protein 1